MWAAYDGQSSLAVFVVWRWCVCLQGQMCYVFCNHKCFIFLGLGAPGPPSPSPPGPSFPFCSFCLWTFLGFLFNRTVLILLLHTLSLPAVFSPVRGISSASLLTALPLILFVMQEAQHLSGPHSSQPGWSLGEIFWTPVLFMSVPYMVLQ